MQQDFALQALVLATTKAEKLSKNLKQVKAPYGSLAAKHKERAFLACIHIPIYAFDFSIPASSAPHKILYLFKKNNPYGCKQRSDIFYRPFALKSQ